VIFRGTSGSDQVLRLADPSWIQEIVKAQDGGVV
jgi:hypothetical protein